MEKWTLQLLEERLSKNQQNNYFWGKEFQCPLFHVLKWNDIILITVENNKEQDPHKFLETIKDILFETRLIKGNYQFKRSRGYTHVELDESCPRFLASRDDFNFYDPKDSFEWFLNFRSFYFFSPTFEFIKTTQYYAKSFRRWELIQEFLVPIINVYNEVVKKYYFKETELNRNAAVAIIKMLHHELFLCDWSNSLVDLGNRWDLNNLPDGHEVCPYYREFISVGW